VLVFSLNGEVCPRFVPLSIMLRKRLNWGDNTSGQILTRLAAQ
jgi:hypothetical protein